MTRLYRSTLLALIALALTATAAFAWQAPLLEPECASSPESFAFTITLGEEENQRIEISYDIGFEHSVVIDFLTAGEHRFDVARDLINEGTTLYVRYESDHEASASAVGNEDLCNEPVEPTPTPKPTPVPLPSPLPSPLAPPPSPQPLLPDTAMGEPEIAWVPFLLGCFVAFVVMTLLLNGRER